MGMTTGSNLPEPTFDVQWEEVYAQGLQMNRWPYDHIVSFFKRAPAHLSSVPGRPISLMEVGFGAGNNLLAAATEGLDVYGIEGSSSAVSVARQRFSEAGLQSDLRHGDFTQLPWDDEVFDLVIDRLALTNTTLEGAITAVGEVWRTLQVGGLFHFNSFGPVYAGVSESELAQGHVRKHDLAGSLKNVGGVTFYAESGVQDLFSRNNWTLEAFQLLTIQSVMPVTELQPNEVISEWRVIARKER